MNWPEEIEDAWLEAMDVVVGEDVVIWPIGSPGAAALGRLRKLVVTPGGPAAVVIAMPDGRVRMFPWAAVMTIGRPAVAQPQVDLPTLVDFADAQGIEVPQAVRTEAEEMQA